MFNELEIEKVRKAELKSAKREITKQLNTLLPVMRWGMGRDRRILLYIEGCSEGSQAGSGPVGGRWGRGCWDSPPVSGLPIPHAASCFSADYIQVILAGLPAP